MVVYECECKYTTHDATKIKRHLNRVESCIINKDMTKIDIKTLIIKPMLKNMTDLSNLTIEEKRERRLQQKIAIGNKNRSLGNMSLEQFAKYLYTSMFISSMQRNHKMILTINIILELLTKTNGIYTVQDTILGNIEFPLMLTNGYHNTASFDRINDKIGYIEENIEIRPYFLNTTFKLTTEMIKEIIEIREQFQNEQELINIIQSINNFNSKNFFYKLAISIQQNSKKSKEIHKTFDFNSIKECFLFLIKKYIEQGGRCAYSNIPIYPKIRHKYKISPERVNPLKGYSKDNIVLIVVGLNSQPAGQFLNKYITEEERQKALNAGKFNQEYWDKCTKITIEISKKCEEAREYGKQILLENLSEEIRELIHD